MIFFKALTCDGFCLQDILGQVLQILLKSKLLVSKATTKELFLLQQQIIFYLFVCVIRDVSNEYTPDGSDMNQSSGPLTLVSHDGWSPVAAPLSLAPPASRCLSLTASVCLSLSVR